MESNRREAAAANTIEATAPPVSESGSPAETRSKAERRREREQAIRSAVGWTLPVIRLLEIVGMGVFLLQMLVTLAIVRLEFEQHWYIVTDRSLRIRTGILRLQESTMSFANVQQVEIRQGPLQRLLGLADVCVRSAGGGDAGAGAGGHGQETALHTGVFDGVTNAVEIRDLIRTPARVPRGRPRRSRRPPSPIPAAAGRRAAEAATVLLTETRALRRALLAVPGSRAVPSSMSSKRRSAVRGQSRRRRYLRSSPPAAA